MIRELARVFYLVAIYFALMCMFAATALSADRATIEALITKEAKANGLDPALLIAIAEVESKLDPKAKGALGEVGLFQLRPEFHKGVREGDVANNVRIAARYLALLSRTCRSTYGSAWFVCHNTGPNRARKLKEPKQFKYYKLVTAVYKERLKHGKATHLIQLADIRR